MQICHLLPCADIFVQLSRLYTLLPQLDDDSDEIAEVMLPVMHLFEMAQTTFDAVRDARLPCGIVVICSVLNTVLQTVRVIELHQPHLCALL